MPMVPALLCAYAAVPHACRAPQAFVSHLGGASATQRNTRAASGSRVLREEGIDTSRCWARIGSLKVMPNGMISPRQALTCPLWPVQPDGTTLEAQATSFASQLQPRGAGSAIPNALGAARGPYL